MARRLNMGEISIYAEACPPGYSMGVRVHRVRWLPNSAAGMTIGRRHILFIDPPDGSKLSQLMAHELVHVRQFAQLGWFGFMRSYLGDYLTELAKHRTHYVAYLAIGLEREARTEAAAWARRHLQKEHPGGQ